MGQPLKNQMTPVYRAPPDAANAWTFLGKGAGQYQQGWRVRIDKC